MEGVMVLENGDTFEVSNEKEIQDALDRIKSNEEGQSLQKPKILSIEEMQRKENLSNTAGSSDSEQPLFSQESEIKSRINFINKDK